MGKRCDVVVPRLPIPFPMRTTTNARKHTLEITKGNTLDGKA
jgi:hypothetical protein